MALDTTVAGATANSYLTVAEADARAATDLGRDVDSWLVATESTKEAALVRATLDLDTFKTNSLEARHLVTQARRFPRSTDVADDVAFLAPRLLDALWAQAKYRLHNADAFVDARARRARGLSGFAGDDGSGTMSLHPELEPVSIEAQRLMDDVLGTVGIDGRADGFRTMHVSNLADDDEELFL